ncbi:MULTISPECIES: putative ABC exporter domain-containing protein [Terrabacteria group]|uniref:putative ABC exporter domain-containing protein n=1 Tax=Bacillati TaxID=1783272 RepID=UPI00193937BA|nr:MULTISPECIES: putative ABC exporter domain-containing protein [Terrabacteria group]MBW9211824.1 putative ABC exporter domain-containing protein [Trueperella sp. zg.1013]QRG87371.1 hypothetical protein JOS54_03425 [Bulleidia sp. zg-1006]
MRILFDLKFRLFINRLKKSFSKPSNIILTILMLVIFGFWLYGMNNFVKMMRLTSSSRYMLMVSLMGFYLTVPTVLSYLKKQGVIFSKADAQFVFQGPFRPKDILIVNGLIAFLQGYLTILVIGIGGMFLYPEQWLRFLVYLICDFFLSALINVSLIILCFGNERLKEEDLKKISKATYVALVLSLVMVLLYTQRLGFSFASFYTVIQSPWLKWIPLIGWEFGFVQFIFVEVNTANIMSAILFVLSAIVLTVIAIRMKCSDQYYEKAEQYASEVAKKVQQAKQKDGFPLVTKGKNLKKAGVQYKGQGAKAIFYRHLLEYKKKKFFIFSFRSLLYLAIAALIFYLRQDPKFVKNVLPYRWFVIPAILIYSSTFGFNGQSKWIQELRYPYTYLIPARSFQKLWEATKMDHLKMAVDALLLSIPCLWILDLSFSYLFMIVIFGLLINGNRMYVSTMVTTIFKNRLGTIGFLLGYIEWIVLGIMYAIPIWITYKLSSIFSAYVLFMIFFGMIVIFTLIMMYLSSLSFHHMEYVEE